MQKALQEKEEQLRTLIDAMPDIVIFKDDQGRYREANDFSLRFLGLEGVDYRGKTDAELAEFTPFYRDAFQVCLESDELAWRARTMSRCDEVIPRPDGLPRVFDVIKAPTFHPDGSRKGLVVVGRDVTERKQAKEELQRSRGTALHFSERLAALQEITNQLSQAESYDDLSRRAVELGRARLGFDRSGIWFVGERLGLAKGSFGIDEQGQLRDERGMEVEFGPDEPDWPLLYCKAPTVIVRRRPLYDHHRRQVGEGSRAGARERGRDRASVMGQDVCYSAISAVNKRYLA